MRGGTSFLPEDDVPSLLSRRRQGGASLKCEVKPMRLGILSDLHIDLNAAALGCSPAELTDLIARTLSGAGLDALVIAGDIGNGEVMSRRLQERLLTALDSHLAASTRIEPGNHDCWSVDGRDRNTHRTYRRLCALPWALPSHPLILGPWSVIGETGWYPLPERETGFEPVFWHQAPADPYNWMIHRLQGQIDAQKGQRLIVALHYVPFRQCIAPQFQGSPLNRFFVVPGLGDLLLQQAPPVEKVIYGHTHVRQQIRVGSLETYCCPLGYRSEWTGSDPEREVLRALAVIDLDVG